MAMADDGSVVVVGFTKGDWVGSNAGQFDFAAFRLDVDGTEVWRYQVGYSKVFSSFRQASECPSQTDVTNRFIAHHEVAPLGGLRASTTSRRSNDKPQAFLASPYPTSLTTRILFAQLLRSGRHGHNKKTKRKATEEISYNQPLRRWRWRGRSTNRSL